MFPRRGQPGQRARRHASCRKGKHPPSLCLAVAQAERFRLYFQKVKMNSGNSSCAASPDLPVRTEGFVPGSVLLGAATWPKVTLPFLGDRGLTPVTARRRAMKAQLLQRSGGILRRSWGASWGPDYIMEAQLLSLPDPVSSPRAPLKAKSPHSTSKYISFMLINVHLRVCFPGNQA